MKLKWPVCLTVIICCLLALVIGIHEETYTHIFSSYFSDEIVKSYGYLYYYQFNLIHLFLKKILVLLSPDYNWYNIIISIICISAIYTILSQFYQYKPNLFTWVTILFAALVFSVDIFNIHFTRAAGLSAIVCVSTLLFGYNKRVFISFFIIGLLTRNEMFWIAFATVCPFLLLYKGKFEMHKKVALLCLAILPLLMFAIANITRYTNFRTEYLYEKNLDTGGFFFAWKSEEQIQDSVQFVKYKAFDNDILADTVNVSQEYLIDNFRYPYPDSMIDIWLHKLNNYLQLFIQYQHYPILSLYLLSFLLIFVFILFSDNEHKQILKKMAFANMLSFLLLCGVTGLFKFEPACQETIFSFIIFINYFYLVASFKKWRWFSFVGILVVVFCTFYLIYVSQESERWNAQNISKLKNTIAEKCEGKLVLPVGFVSNIFMKHTNPYILNDNSLYKDILLVSSYGGSMLFLDADHKINKYFKGNILYNYDMIKQISQCQTCNSVFVATSEDIKLYAMYYRLIYKCDISFPEMDELGVGEPYVEGKIYLYGPPALKCLSDTLR